MGCIDTIITERRLAGMPMSDIYMQSQYPQSSSFIGTGLGNYASSIPICPPPPQRRKTMLENVKGYIEKHKDIIFTLGLVILVDHFLFKGALRKRIKKTVEGVLSKAENMITHKED
jgi:hypothetical protein